MPIIDLKTLPNAWICRVKERFYVRNLQRGLYIRQFLVDDVIFFTHRLGGSIFFRTCDNEALEMPDDSFTRQYFKPMHGEHHATH